jgi:hypothetical protein
MNFPPLNRPERLPMLRASNITRLEDAIYVSFPGAV